MSSRISGLQSDMPHEDAGSSDGGGSVGDMVKLSATIALSAAIHYIANLPGRKPPVPKLVDAIKDNLAPKIMAMHAEGREMLDSGATIVEVSAKWIEAMKAAGVEIAKDMMEQAN